MGDLKNYRQIIQKVFDEYARYPYAHGDIQKKMITDHEHSQYLLMAIGWDGPKRIHGCIAHIDIIDGKLWIQRDGTEHGFATDLEREGIPKEHIVLGFHSPSLRQYTEYAVA